MHQGRRRQPNLGVMLLFYQLFGVIGIDRLPPVTLGTIGLHVAIFLRLFKLPWYKPTQVCVSAYKVWKQKEYSRLLFAAFEHGDDWHLYYNMVSFALKGQSLERRFGRVKFLYILTVFSVLTNAVLVALNLLASEYLGDFEDQCAVGFSGVIFALKVLTTYYDTGFTRVMGLPILVPSRYAVWAELVLIQMLVPNVSFYGHLAGILVGMAYVTGPLRFVMDLIYSLAKGIIFPPAPRFQPRAEPSGYSGERFSSFVPPGMSEEEQIRRATEESMQDSYDHRTFGSSPYGNSRSPPYGNSGSPPDGNFRSPPYGNFGNSPPPPPGFTYPEQNYAAPPPAGFSPDIEEMRAKREAKFKY